MKFSELVRLLEHNGFTIIKEKGSADRNLSCHPTSGRAHTSGGVT